MIQLFKSKQSTTLFMVVIAVFILFFKFLVSGMTFPIIGEQSPITAVEFGTAFAAILAPWIAREWKEKDLKKNV